MNFASVHAAHEAIESIKSVIPDVTAKCEDSMRASKYARLVVQLPNNNVG